MAVRPGCFRVMGNLGLLTRHCDDLVSDELFLNTTAQTSTTTDSVVYVVI